VIVAKRLAVHRCDGPCVDHGSVAHLYGGHRGARRDTRENAASARAGMFAPPGLECRIGKPKLPRVSKRQTRDDEQYKPV
jgi:hypothetical protein